MTETDSIRLTRVEEKLDALIDRLDERCAHRAASLAEVRKDVDSLKTDRAKVIGGAVAGGAILAWLGNLALKLVGVKIS